MSYDPALPDATRIGGVALVVRDLDNATRFYERVLGLRLHGREDGVARLGAGRPFLTLHGDPDAPDRPPRATGLYHVAYLLPSRADLARALENLLRRGWPVEGASDHHVSEAVYLSDPEGNGIELYADRPRESWGWTAGGGVDMRTGMLDVHGLLAEAKGAPWQGAPDGMRVGHVHLQVDDAARAEAFYRDLLGFGLTARYGPQASFLSAGGYHHHVAVNAWQSQGGPHPPPGAAGLRRFDVEVPAASDVEAVAARLAKAAHPLSREDGAVVTRDPAGNEVRVAAEGG